MSLGKCKKIKVDNVFGIFIPLDRLEILHNELNLLLASSEGVTSYVREESDNGIDKAIAHGFHLQMQRVSNLFDKIFSKC